MYGNHKSATTFREKAREFEFYGRLGHRHAIGLVREADERRLLAMIEVNESGVVSMRHSNTTITRNAMASPTYEHIALLIGFPNEPLSINIYDERHQDTDIIRYRPVDSRFYIPAQYLDANLRVAMATRNNFLHQVSKPHPDGPKPTVPKDQPVPSGSQQTNSNPLTQQDTSHQPSASGLQQSGSKQSMTQTDSNAQSDSKPPSNWTEFGNESSGPMKQLEQIRSPSLPLWKFIWRCLATNDTESIIWINPVEGTFKINDPPGFLAQWQAYANRPEATYAVIGQALKRHEDEGILERIDRDDAYSFKFTKLAQLFDGQSGAGKANNDK